MVNTTTIKVARKYEERIQTLYSGCGEYTVVFKPGWSAYDYTGEETTCLVRSAKNQKEMLKIIRNSVPDANYVEPEETNNVERKMHNEAFVRTIDHVVKQEYFNASFGRIITFVTKKGTLKQAKIEKVLFSKKMPGYVVVIASDKAGKKFFIDELDVAWISDKDSNTVPNWLYELLTEKMTVCMMARLKYQEMQKPKN